MILKKRTTSVIPFGYDLHEELPGMLEPNETELDYLKQAFEYLRRGCPYRATARWITARAESN